MSIKELKPELLWNYFYQLTQIPRPSYHEEQVQQFILDEAKKLGLWAERDAGGNVLVRKPASKGMEKAKGVILQGHLDMVAQKNQDTEHDFLKDPIQAYVDGEWVRAKGTTLGADNGIGAAAALAVLADKTLTHGPLEALFTATEETSMDGAKALKPNWIQGEVLVNLDNEVLGEICIGCAGGVTATYYLPVAFEANKRNAFALSIRGLTGGHSGLDIIKQRGNANKIMTRLLLALGDKIRVASFQGGTLHNAIPREADAVFVSDASLDELKVIVAQEEAVIRRGLPAEEVKSLQITLTAADKKPEQCWTKAAHENILRILNLCPSGVDRMSVVAQGLVETSINLARVQVEKDQLEVLCLIRSSDNECRDNLANRVRDLFLLSGGSSKFEDEYPGWQPIAGAEITDILVREGEKIFGKTPKVNVIHAGLECGIMGQNYPNWQMASIGPDITMPHSPDERVRIESVAVFWKWLLAVLAEIK